MRNYVMVSNKCIYYWQLFTYSSIEKPCYDHGVLSVDTPEQETRPGDPGSRRPATKG